MKYEFGIMSKKWSLEANNDDVAFVTMVMFIEKPLPIVVYKPFSKVINNKIVFDMDNLGMFVEHNKEELIKCKNSIKELGL